MVLNVNSRVAICVLALFYAKTTLQGCSRSADNLQPGDTQYFSFTRNAYKKTRNTDDIGKQEMRMINVSISNIYLATDTRFFLATFFYGDVACKNVNVHKRQTKRVCR